MFDPKIKFNPELMRRLKEAAKSSGASSVDEFVQRILELELERMEREKKKQAPGKASQQEIDDITNKLKGLGYID